jgi:hypothetical protein
MQPTRTDIRQRPNNNDRTPVRSEPVQRTAPGLNKPIAALLWGLACLTTYQLVQVLRPELRLEYTIAAAIVSQVVFTWLERPVLGGRPNHISTAALVLDTLINAGGIFPMALRAAETPPAQMLIAAFKLAPGMSPAAGAVLALVFGFLLAAAPEAVWHWKA